MDALLWRINTVVILLAQCYLGEGLVTLERAPSIHSGDT